MWCGGSKGLKSDVCMCTCTFIYYVCVLVRLCGNIRIGVCHSSHTYG